jgi:hypothetical protein
VLLEPWLRDFPRQQMLLRQLCGRGEKARVFDVGDLQPVIETLLQRFETSPTKRAGAPATARLIMQLISLLPQQEQAAGHNTFSSTIIRWLETTIISAVRWRRLRR